MHICIYGDVTADASHGMPPSQLSYSTEWCKYLWLHRGKCLK